MAILSNAEGEEIDKEWKNYCVIDDSSKFAAAVYYHYINKEILKDEKQEKRTAYDIDLWGTSSTMFLYENEFTNKLIKTDRFVMYTLDQVKSKNIYGDVSKMYKEVDLQAGDLICREGNVEFYIDKNSVIGWQRVHNTKKLNKKYSYNKDEFYFYNTDELDKGFKYNVIIRFKKG